MPEGDAATTREAAPATGALEHPSTRGLSPGEFDGNGKEGEADAMRNAANILLPRLNHHLTKNLSPNQQGRLQQPPAATTTTPKAQISVSSALPKLPTSGAASGMRSSRAPIVISMPHAPLRTREAPSVVVARRSNDAPLSLAHGTSILLDLVSHTRAWALAVFRNAWNVCRGFWLRFRPRDRPRSGRQF